MIVVSQTNAVGVVFAAVAVVVVVVVESSKLTNLILSVNVVALFTLQDFTQKFAKIQSFRCLWNEIITLLLQTTYFAILLYLNDMSTFLIV